MEAFHQFPKSDSIRVTFEKDRFLAFVGELSRSHADQWIALLMGEEDPATGLTSGTILAHDLSEDAALRTAVAYHEQHSDATIRFFNTVMGVAGRAGAGQ